VCSAHWNGFSREVFPQFIRGFCIFFCRHSGQNDMSWNTAVLVPMIQFLQPLMLGGHSVEMFQPKERRQHERRRGLACVALVKLRSRHARIAT
jgi:hypothetical protein